MDFHVYFIEFSTGYNWFPLVFHWNINSNLLKWQLYFHCYFMNFKCPFEFPIKFQIFGFQFLVFLRISNGFPLVFHWNCISISNGFPLIFHWNFNWISNYFLLAFHWNFHWYIIEISTGFIIDPTGIPLKLNSIWISNGFQFVFH